MKLFLGLATGLVCGSLCCGVAQAEVGKASASPGEWFLGFNVGGGATWGPDRQAFLNEEDGTLNEVDFDDGEFYFGGLEAGYVFQEPASLIDRIELNVDFRISSRDLSRDPGNALFVMVNEDGDNSINSRDDPALVGEGDEEGSEIELRLSFKSTVLESDSHVVIASLEPFFRYQDLDGRTDLENIPSPVSRYDDIEADYYGAQLALEVETPLSETMSLIGRVSAGAYYVESDIDSHIELEGNPFGVVVGDSDSTWGGRFGGAVGVKIPLYYTGASLTLLGTVDYMTDVATIDHFVDNDDITQPGFDDALDVGGRVGLVFPLK